MVQSFIKLHHGSPNILNFENRPSPSTTDQLMPTPKTVKGEICEKTASRSVRLSEAAICRRICNPATMVYPLVSAERSSARAVGRADRSRESKKS